MSADFNKVELKSQIAAVLKYSQNYPFEVNVDDLFKNWFAAKRDIVEAFGGKLIYEYPTPVTFKGNQAHKNQLLEDFIRTIVIKYHNPALANFIDLNKNGFFDNKVIKTTDSKMIPVGMKLVKAFRNFVVDKDTLYELQSQASQLIQEGEMRGILCISVHPLDFLSSSENTYNWRSCHALDGEYRCGNLSYMQDSCTTICYIKSNEDLTKIPNFPEEVPWNSKKWRMLLYISEAWDMLMAGRQYPFVVQGALDFILTHLLTRVKIVADRSDWNGWSDTFIDSLPVQISDDGQMTTYKMRGKMIPGGDFLRPINEVVVDCENALHFNDLIHSSCYNPFYTYKRYANGEIPSFFPKFFVGHEVKCVCCGKDKVNMPSTFLCDSCDLEYGTEDNDLYATCDCCGRRFFADDGVWVGDDWICPNCAENETAICERCGERVFNDSIEYYAATDSYICTDCIEEIKDDKSYYGKSHLHF